MTILTSHFWPETNAGSRRLSAAAEHFQHSGWRVTVITLAPHHPENRVKNGYGGTWRSMTEENGIRVVRFAPLLVSPTNLPLRLISELLFALKATVQALLSRPEVVLASSPYMFLGPAALVASRLTGASFAWDVRDLTWKYVKATGHRTFGLEHLLNWLMSFTVRHTDALTTATKGQMEELGAIAIRKRAVITNGLTEQLMADLGSGQPTLNDGRFTTVYAGLLGFPQGLSTLIDAAAFIPDARFIIAGTGPEAHHLKERARERALENVEFLGQLHFNDLRNLYASADVLVALLRGSEAFKVAQPSKVWEYMATGKPVLFAGDCEATEIILKEDIGVVVPPEDARALAESLLELAKNPSERKRLGKRGRIFVTAERNRNRILEQWQDLLKR